MFTEEGIFSIGDGLLDVDAERLKGLLVSHDINEIYEVEQTPFARGKFAAVRRAIHKNTGLHFAAKFLKRRRRAQSSDKEIKHEIAVLMLCEGEENIVNLNAVHETRSDTALLLELATGGELQTILDNEECLSEAHARHCMREVLKALKFLHDRSIAHLDLKPQNILLAGERIEDGLKLCDFGISRVVCEGINVREMAGTPDYVAPEVLQYEPLSLLTDIWSVGVLAYVLLSGFSPFGGDTKQETFLNISQCALTFPDNLFGGVSQAAIDFIRRALRIKPNDRMNAAGCLEHIWLKDECALDRQMYIQTPTDADYVNEPEEEDEDDEDVEEEDVVDEEEVEVEPVAQQQDSTATTTTAAAAATITQSNGNDCNSSSSSSRSSSQSNNKSTHNGHQRAHGSTASKIPIAATKYSSSNSNSSSSGSKPSSPITETTTAIHTLPGLLLPTTTTATTTATGTTTTTAVKPTQIVTPTRRASDSDKENTYTATFIKKPAKLQLLNGGSSSLASSASTSTATILIGGGGGEVATVTLPNGCLFPDAPTTPKVIRKAPSAEPPATSTSVKALVKKFQLENGSGSDNDNETQQQHHHHHPQLPLANGTRKCSAPGSAISMRRSCSGVGGGSTSSSNSSLASCGGGGGGVSTNGFTRRASEPLTAVHKKQANGSANVNVNVNGSVISSGSGSGSSGGSANGSTGSATLLLNGRLPAHLHHHHMHHHHHHHHVVAMTKSAAVAATNNLSRDQGIIC